VGKQSSPAAAPGSTTNTQVINEGTLTGMFTVGQWVQFSTNLGSDWTGHGLSGSNSISGITIQANGFRNGSTQYGQEIFLDSVSIA